MTLRRFDGNQHRGHNPDLQAVRDTTIGRLTVSAAGHTMNKLTLLFALLAHHARQHRQRTLSGHNGGAECLWTYGGLLRQTRQEWPHE